MLITGCPSRSLPFALKNAASINQIEPILTGQESGDESDRIQPVSKLLRYPQKLTRHKDLQQCKRMKCFGYKLNRHLSLVQSSTAITGGDEKKP